MHNLKIKKYESLLNWTMIYWGIECDILYPETAVFYADMLAEKNPDIDNPEIIELLIAENVQKNLNRSNAPALLAKSRACERLQPTQGALAPQGFSGRLQLPLKF